MEKKSCNKIAFDTEDESRAELERILTTQRKPWKKEDKKPCRFFLCEKCNSYHLTSQPFITEYKKPSTK